jgi:hypothetical protein
MGGFLGQHLAGDALLVQAKADVAESRWPQPASSSRHSTMMPSMGTANRKAVLLSL